jgi:hypothetical protein
MIDLFRIRFGGRTTAHPGLASLNDRVEIEE